MSDSHLLLDLGNSRIKWGVVQAGRLQQRGVADYPEDEQPLQLPEALQTQAFCSIVAASVTSEARAARVEAWTKQQGWPLHWVRSESELGGVRNGYPEPERLGVDRLLALIGARHLGLEAGCVVDVGTAMTLDGVDATGQHLGGLIIPGPALMRRSLLGAAPVFSEYAEQAPLDCALDTASAVVSGTTLAAVALSDHFARSVQGRCEAPISVVFAGGDGEAIMATHQWRDTGWPCWYRDDLVLQGLLVMLERTT
jgi:type III pantothenate kinase